MIISLKPGNTKPISYIFCNLIIIGEIKVRNLIKLYTLLFFLLLSITNAEQYKVMTFNIHHGTGTDSVYDINRISTVIADSEANVVGLQEVDNGYSSRSNNDHQPEILSTNLSMYYFYGPNIGTRYGNLILSEYPLESGAYNYSLPNPQGTEPRGVIVSQVSLMGETINFLVTHFSAYAESTNRQAQTQALKDLSLSLSGPVVIMGDFNCTASGDLAALFEGGYFVSSRDILGMSSSIDDIIVSANLSDNVISGDEIPTIASDHDPYYIVLEVTPSSTNPFWTIYE